MAFMFTSDECSQDMQSAIYSWSTDAAESKMDSVMRIKSTVNMYKKQITLNQSKGKASLNSEVRNVSERVGGIKIIFRHLFFETLAG